MIQTASITTKAIAIESKLSKWSIMRRAPHCTPCLPDFCGRRCRCDEMSRRSNSALHRDRSAYKPGGRVSSFPSNPHKPSDSTDCSHPSPPPNFFFHQVARLVLRVLLPHFEQHGPQQRIVFVIGAQSSPREILQKTSCAVSGIAQPLQ